MGIIKDVIKDVANNAATIIALCACCISLYMANLLRKDFIATHRPYVYAISRRTKEGHMDINTVLVRCENAVARMTSFEFFYFIPKTKEYSEEIKGEVVWEKKFDDVFIYPHDQPEYFHVTSQYKFIEELFTSNPKFMFRRQVIIKYKELSGKKTYSFVGCWDWNWEADIWELSKEFVY